ncbi:MAG: sigma-70 family RNA polymerase sigma factor [Deltaproteobacteria bacterium]|nr:sigma-70 family RNA polymerase sigma factor [Deltaproteobacteria bacterium]
MPQTDAVLDSLASVVRAHRADLTALARREGLGAEDAVDCVHDAFCTYLKLGLRGELPAHESEHPAWLAGAVVNEARNRRRLHALAKPHDPLDDLELEDAETPEALVARAEDCVRLRGCVNKLCKTQRTVVMMRLLEERPGEDVAAALGITRGHVDVLVHRAKASLRVCMIADHT